ncbi:MAG TPA: hypothetical protein DD640_10510 [Clostridiales bacterium]|nr:hypothetical protein [Clostridiales bacterium]
MYHFNIVYYDLVYYDLLDYDLQYDMNVYLKSLIDLHIVSKEFSVGKQGSGKPLYQVSDQMYRFWYRFVQPYQRYVETDRGKEIYYAAVQGQIPAFMGCIFEEIVFEYMQLPSVRQKMICLITEEGRWWGSDPVRRQEVEIDYVSLGSGGTILGEAKWRNGLLLESVYLELIEKGRLLAGEKRIFSLQ